MLSNLVGTTRFLYSLHHICSKSEGKQSNVKIIPGSNKIIGLKQGSQNRLRLPISEGGES